MASSLQQRRRSGRRYLRAYGWFMLAVNCVLLMLLAKRYFTGALNGNVHRYTVGMLFSFVISVILILAARSE